MEFSSRNFEAVETNKQLNTAGNTAANEKKISWGGETEWGFSLVTTTEEMEG